VPEPHEVIDYAAFLTQRIVEAISQAHAAARPVELRTASPSSADFRFNRRFHMKDGSCGSIRGSSIRRSSARVADRPDVGIVLLQSNDGRKIWRRSRSFPLHLDTVGGPEYSADYPFYLERNLRAKLGNQFVSLFRHGTCGDINHVDVTSPGKQSGHEESSLIGPLWPTRCTGRCLAFGAQRTEAGRPKHRRERADSTIHC